MAAACRGGAQLARGLGLTPAAWVLAARQRPTSAGGRAGGSSGLAGCAQHASHVSASRARCAAAQLLRPSALTAGPAAAALASQQRTLALGGGAAIGAGGSRAGAVAAAAAAAAGLRSVGTVHRGKIIGNVMEAWERRTVDGIVEKRDPAHFDDFRVSASSGRACVVFVSGPRFAALLAQEAAAMRPVVPAQPLTYATRAPAGGRLRRCAVCQRVESAEARHVLGHLHCAAGRYPAGVLHPAQSH